MLKRILMVIMVSCLLPVMAHAANWSLTSAAKTAGGTIQVGTGAPRTYLQGNLVSTYTYTTTPTAVDVTVAVTPGYAVSKVVINGVTTNNPTQTAWQVVGPTTQTFNVYFAAQKFSIVASVAGNVGGTVSPASITNLTGGTQLGTARVITYTPVSSYYTLSNIAGIPSGATQSPSSPLPGQQVTVTFPSTFTVVGNSNLVGTFVSNNPTANAGSTQNVFAGSTVTLNANNSQVGGGIAAYTWTQTSGPATVTITNATLPQATFVPTVGGTYTFSLTLMPGGSTASTTVVVSADANQKVLADCQGCHAANYVDRAINAYNKWSTSKHEVNAVICANCHSGADTGNHPGVVSTNICMSCHVNNFGTTSPAVAIGHNGITDTLASTCYSCHNHDLGVSGGTLSCTTCHNNPPTTGQYYTGVVKYTHPAGLTTCASCHAEPAVYNDPATPTHRDGVIEILTNNTACAVCHSYPPSSSAHNTAVGGTTPNCTTCHIYTGFTGATHNNGTKDFANMSCTTCHGMPPTTLTSLSTNVGPHPPATASNCALCHGYLPTDSSASGLHQNGTINVVIKGAPHFNNSTSTSAYRASYVTSNATCADCHNSSATNQAIRQQWAATAHGATTDAPFSGSDFKTRATCVRCHTTTGFIAYSTAKIIAPWGLASDKTKEVITCVACHSNVEAGTVRTVTPNKPYTNKTSFTNVDVATSNICMDCHGGRDTGSAAISLNIGKLTLNAAGNGTVDYFNNAASSYSTHYLPAGGILQGEVGFNYPGRSYAAYTDNAHSKVGTANTNNTGSNGPCVACHMSSDMSAAGKHKLSPVTADATSRTIIAITTNVCSNCHAATLPASTLDSKRLAFVNAVEVLRVVLADKGFLWTPATDNFNSGAKLNWGTGQNGANVMGAAHNYKLFVKEAGAYAHNPEYAKQLIADSIEAVVTGGSVTGSDISAYLDSLVASNKLTTAQVSSLNLFKNITNSCNNCHSFPPATTAHATATTSPLNCSTCHAYTGMGGATHNNGFVDLTNMTCSSCHGNPPSSQTIHTSGTVKYLHNQVTVTYTDCSQCHETPATYAATATHRDGTVEIKSNTTACSSCHGYPPATVASGAAHVNDTNCANCHDYTTYSGSLHNNGTVNFKTGTAACSSCHGYPPATQTIHANGAVKYNHDKVAVNYTDCTQCHSTPATPTATATHLNGTVDLLTNVNACSSCHLAPPTTTAHAAATLAPFNCTNCHTYTVSSAALHNNGSVDFSGSLTCDTCHGYPPLPLDQFNARTGGAFANAKVEDYTNGGGHHATHLLSTVSANEGFTPCLPCHPNSAHAQGGGTVLKTNINVFSATDLDYRFDEARPKQYNVASQSCSNVSCHFQPTAQW